MPENQVFLHFAKYIALSNALKEELSQRIVSKTLKKGELVHSAHNVCTSSYFIRKGLLRIYFLKEGQEISEFFCAENEWVNSPKSFMQRQLDIYWIDAIEETEAFSLHISDLGYLLEHFPEMERYARLSMGTIFAHLLERISSLRFTSAKERYEHFCSVYQTIHARIPLGMVASYLGIAQETLSRIRALK